MDTNKRKLVIATKIMSKLGAGRFKAMTGAKDFALTDNGIRFKIGRNATQTNTVTIELNGVDTYDMTFEKVSLSRKTWEITRKVISKNEGVCKDMMRDTFTDVTGMYTSL